MGFFKQKAGKKTFLYILLSIFISISATIAVLASILYLNFENIAVSLITSSMCESLEHISYSATFMDASARNMMNQLSIDSRIEYLLSNREPAYPQLSACLNQLSAYKFSSNFTESIYVYNQNTDTVYSTRNYGASSRTDFSDQDVFTLLAHPDVYNMQNPVFRIISSEGTQAESEGVFTYILSNYAAGADSPVSSVVLNVSASWMQDTILAIQRTAMPGTTLLFDADRNALDLSTLQLSDSARDSDYAAQIFQAGQASGSLILPVDGVNSLIIYVFSDSLDWVFVRIVPYASITSRVEQLRHFTLLCSAAILLVGILIVFLLSRGLYQSYHSMDHRVRKLEQKNWNQSQLLQQERYRKLLLGESFSGAAAEEETLCPAGSSLRVLLFQFDHFQEVSGQLPPAERSLYGYALINMACELFAMAGLHGEGVPMGDSETALLVRGADPSPQQIDSVLSQLLANMERHFSVSFSVAVSEPSREPARISQLYAQCLQAADYRIFSGPRSVLYYEDTCKTPPAPCVYPVKEENLLIEQLVQGKLEEAKGTYQRIMDTLKSGSFRSFHLMTLKLLTSIYIARDGLDQKNASPDQALFSEFSPFMDSWEFMDDVDRSFYRLFEEIVQIVNAKKQLRKSEKYTVLVRQVVQEIQDRYADPNLSLYSLEALGGMNAAYLGRIFKQEQGCSVSDYINRVRVERSKALLTSSDAPIAEIAGQVGFSSSNYFYSVFKKCTGITPAVFRQCGGFSGPREGPAEEA